MCDPVGYAPCLLHGTRHEFAAGDAVGPFERVYEYGVTVRAPYDHGALLFLRMLQLEPVFLQIGKVWFDVVSRDLVDPLVLNP